MTMRHCGCMRERATLKLDTGAEVRVEVERDDLDRDEIVVRRSDDHTPSATNGLLSVVDEHLAAAARHAAVTTDRHLSADRLRPY